MDDPWDYEHGHPVYNFCVLASECGADDYWAIAIGATLTLTPPCIPQEETPCKRSSLTCS